jgi:hypothetical protein
MAYEEGLRSLTFDADASIVATTGVSQQKTLAISNKVLTTNVVTLTTSTVHGLVTGQNVTVVMTAGDTDKATLDGSYVVASVPSETTFTYAKTATNISTAAATGQVIASVPNPKGFQYRFVKLSAARTAALCNTTSNELPIGVLQNKPQIVGAACTVATNGISLVEAGGAVTAGEPVKVDSLGRVVNATRGTDAALYVGAAVTGSTAAGQLVSVFIKVS